jgi:predicted ABC-type transport system involved in lysophospholipase L1 biosynthesis ATPase subunit
MSVIELQDVTRVYRIGEVETRALRGVTLTVEEGEFTAIVGPSGSGKTTLLQLLGCLDKPTNGTVRVKGQDVTRLNANQRADLRKGTIGFVFQFFALIPGLTAYENVELPLLLMGKSGKERKERVTELLAAVGLSDRAHHRPRPGHPSRPGAGRRANGQPGHRERPSSDGNHAAAEPGDGHDFPLRHPRPARDSFRPARGHAARWKSLGK